MQAAGAARQAAQHVLHHLHIRQHWAPQGRCAAACWRHQLPALPHHVRHAPRRSVHPSCPMPVTGCQLVGTFMPRRQAVMLQEDEDGRERRVPAEGARQLRRVRSRDVQLAGVRRPAASGSPGRREGHAVPGAAVQSGARHMLQLRAIAAGRAAAGERHTSTCHALLLRTGTLS